MGSSKKHKDKDRDRYSKRRHRRSRSISKEKEYESTRDKDRDRHSSKYKKRHRSRSPSFDDEYSSNRKYASAKREKKEINDDRVDIPAPKSSGGDASLSIEETNKLRLKLGLKPLEIASKSTAEDDESKISTQTEEVFVKTENIAEKKRAETLREKLAARKEKRRIQKKMLNVKGLADSDSDDNASAWINKSRKISIEKKKADERAKMLEEMDEEFGVGDLVEEELSKVKAQVYSSNHLSGMNIGHSKSAFKDGCSTILTLKDQDVLNEDEDVLLNVNIADDEHADRNTQNKKNTGGYKPYDEPEFDEFGELKKKDLLYKYNEEIDGPKSESFKLGSGGMYDNKTEAAMAAAKARIKDKKSESLKLPEPVIASEFYTADEMVKFKKTKKKVRKVRKKVLRADDLEPLGDSTNDLGVRLKTRGFEDSSKNALEDMEIVVQPTLSTKQEIVEEEDLGNVVIDDDAELDLQTALNKARKLKQLAATKSGIEKVANVINQSKREIEGSKDGVNDGISIVMNETAEFCRALGDIPTYGQSGNREDEDDIMDVEVNVDKTNYDNEEESHSGWNEVEIDETPVNIQHQDETPILEEEPVVGSGIGSALKLATQKGYLDKEIKKVNISAKNTYLQAENYTIEDKNYDDDKSNHRRSDRFMSGPISDFKDKELYKPEIKLDYIDDNGRILSQKEAFRYLSHKFHGKGSGKIKTEKRVKKLEEDVLLRKMSSTDTPLKTLSLLQDKQRETQSPYVILSGGSKALQSNSLSKTK